MEQAEQEKLIEELENRVDRLRALYEQFFMGIERIEPLILRKDVDRRVWVLWREQIRNTGLRFKMHTIVQRYNTYQQYWQRICREIEAGTYQRDLRRAAERFGDAALTSLGKRRKKMFDKGVAKKAERDAARQKAAGLEVSVPAPGPQGAVEAAPPSAAGPASAAGSSPPPSRPAIARAPAARRAPARRPAPEAFEPLELDMLSDFGEEPGTGSLQAPRMPSIDVSVAAPKAAPAAPARPPGPTDDEIEPATLRPPPKPASLPAATRPAPVPRAPAAQPPAAARPAAVPAPAPGPAAFDDELPTTRIRQIYGQYVDAKRKCNESTASLTFDKISKDLRDTAQRLRQKHAGKRIDFEIVLKNGTPVLRPVIKS